LTAQAQDYRKTHPHAWSAFKVEDGIKALYGDVTLVQDDRILLKSARFYSNRDRCHIYISSTLLAKSIAVFSSTNPRVLIAVMTVIEGEKVYFTSNVKFQRPTNLIVVLEGLDGVFYTNKRFIDVATSICSGGEDEDLHIVTTEEESPYPPSKTLFRINTTTQK